MKTKIMFLAFILLASFAASAQESAFASDDSDEVIEDSAPMESAFIEPKADVDSEMNEAIGDLKNDFAHKVPEPSVKKSNFVRMNSSHKTSKVKRAKIAKHIKAKKKTAAKAKKKNSHIAKLKKRAKPGRAVASVSKSKKRILAKRGQKSKTRVR